MEILSITELRLLQRFQLRLVSQEKKVSVEIKSDLLITGASEAYEEGITPELPYVAETIQAAIQERANRLEGSKS